MEVSVEADVLGRIGTALADRSRRRILLLLLDGPSYPAAIAEELGLTRGATASRGSASS